MAASGSSHETLIEFNMRLAFRSRSPEFSGRGRNKRVDSRFLSALMSTVQLSAALKRRTLNVELGAGMAALADTVAISRMQTMRMVNQ
jgi:hypothetical protein